MTRKFAFILFVSLASSSASGFQSPEETFFENKIRPVLIEHCYKCHNSVERDDAGLALDWREAIRDESESGFAVLPGKPTESLLIQAIRHELPGLEMPQDGAKLSDEVIADFEKWIADGAFDPRETEPTAAEIAEATSWNTLLQQRKKWWSLTPIRQPTVPDRAEFEHPIDKFIAEKLAEHQLQFSMPADKRTLIRRLTFALTGLPPTVKEIQDFLADESENAFSRLVDRLLASPHYGERWARHWMDLVRYADSHGSEGDPSIPNIYRYRDYLIRAFNSDLPYDQLVREHIAGDLLPEPRINERLGLNESAIGPAHFRLCFHGFAPTDAMDEKVRFVDDQINVLGKTFLGLTVSCARCHDHKFDAISQADYTAMFGILGSVRPAMRDVNTKQKSHLHISKIKEFKKDLRHQIGMTWLQQHNGLETQLQDAFTELKNKMDSGQQVPAMGPVGLYLKLKRETESGKPFAEVWEKFRADLNAQLRVPKPVKWETSVPELKSPEEWFQRGVGLKPVGPGEFTLHPAGTEIISSVLPSGVYSHQLSQTHGAVLESPKIDINGKFVVYARVMGKNSSLRYVVQDYPRDGTVYPIPRINRNDWYWQRLDLSYWQGDKIHFELATSKDAPLVVGNDEQSWFGIRECILQPAHAEPPAQLDLAFAASLPKRVESLEDLERAIKDRIHDSLYLWTMGGDLTDGKALLLDAAIKEGYYPNSIDDFSSKIQNAVKRYRKLNSLLPVATRVPGVVEGDSTDSPLFDRGDHRKPLALVRRRFLEAIDDTPYEPEQSGRLQLAHDILRPDNPLTARVIVNRLWHHLYGQGIVSTPDNFGKLGSLPTHPDLLDYLASRMVKKGWSIKDTIRFMVTSETWQRQSIPNQNARTNDPQNKWLSHANLRRLDAESIRDSMLVVSGTLDKTMFGPGFAANSNAKRRSVYVQSRRNNLDKFLSTFDSPVPFSTTGSRSRTNVPAQSLTLMNGNLANHLAKEWQETVSSQNKELDENTIEWMFEGAVGRLPDEPELEALHKYYTAYWQDGMRRRAQADKAQKIIDELRTKEQLWLRPIKDRLSKENIINGGEGPKPYLSWDFTNTSEAKRRLNLQGSAKLNSTGLVLDGNGFATTAPLKTETAAKTLAVWLQLPSLEQKGGGAFTIQSLDGQVFDSIVFAERNPRQWISGSNGFTRTSDVNGPDETAEPVFIAITYSKEGSIQIYRNGQEYGAAYRKSNLQQYAARDSHFVFGLRHGTSVTSGRMLNATLTKAQFFDRALSSEEVAAVSAGTAFVSDQQLLNALNDQRKRELLRGRERILELQQQIENLGPNAEPEDALVRVAHAIFNLKEFIYVK